MNRLSLSSVMLVFLMASLPRYQDAKVVRSPNLSTTLRPSSKNTTSHAVNKVARVNRPCISDTLLPQSFKGVRKIWSKHKYLLQITKNGVVNGTSDMKSCYANLQLESLGKGLFRAKGVIAQSYLSMDRLGRLYTRKIPNLESVFQKVPVDDGFVALKNYVHCLYVGLKRNGQPKRGIRVRADQHSAHFLELKDENTC